MSDKLLWWGYLHTEGTIQLKRYFDRRDIEDANESPFCEIVIGPFYAKDREDASFILQERIGEIKNN